MHQQKKLSDVVDSSVQFMRNKIEQTMFKFIRAFSQEMVEIITSSQHISLLHVSECVFVIVLSHA